MLGWGLRPRRGLLVLLSEGCRIFGIRYGWGFGWDGIFWTMNGGGWRYFYGFIYCVSGGGSSGLDIVYVRVMNYECIRLPDGVFWSTLC